MKNLKKFEACLLGDIVMHEFRERYDRELYRAIIVEIDYDLATVVAISEDEKGYYYQGLEDKVPIGRLKKVGRMEDYGLSF